MRSRAGTTGAAVAAVVLCAAAAVLAAWVDGQAPGLDVSVSGAVYAVGCAAIGALLVHLRPRNPIGWLLVLVGLLQALSAWSNAYGGYGVDVAEPDWPLAPVVAQVGVMVWLPSLVLPATVLVAIYPSGRLPARWWRWPVGAVAAGLGVLTALSTLDPSAYDDVVRSRPAPVSLPPSAWTTAALVAAAVAVIGGALVIWAGTAVRLVHARGVERQQLAWLTVVVLPLMVVVFVVPVPNWLFAGLAWMVPGSVLVGVVFYRLLGIVVSRALVYLALTGAVVLLYLSLAAAAAAAFGRTLSPVAGAVAAALLAVALSPGRVRLQAAADRFVYGRRRDPVGAVTELGDRVASAPEGDLLPAVLDTVTAALRSPGAHVASPGVVPADDGAVAVPLRVSGQDVGTLLVAQRAPGEPFTPADRRLLAVLAPQVAVVVRALELAGELEHERVRVLSATHTERDRIRRDLHDGLGPTLAGIGLAVQAVQAQLGERAGPESAALLARLKDEVDAAVGEVRRILDGLRPAPLDDVGLVAALQRHAAALAPTVPVRVTAEELPSLRPDVETAAYRIAQEALTNVARHSRARSAELGLRARDGRLEVAVADDGAGFTPADPVRPDGVGLESMRTRAQAVGGDLTVTSGPTGTRVVAGLPLEVSR
ncbi:MULTISPECIES: GAF domain-containing sensor histidine kinase [unclassified Modestobacter]|uniref:GAF domain-containing sensor histidine kinase n=1 Tax=unclassified Modestobacter TaxID=2643866 RepID=UPI0022AA93BE|nr:MULTISPECIES: GAF domain-containing sensor histidine kinase [unclassified Modestobacter]MCZ2826650.1 GAF domain-containing sensor histidine kinase [Modestobacter sp. VKM Ac-2981]MCZ2855030.1 GAF domain-containing sensor histidine kinase [Modestobacter sp. VKM Ac-2982]